MVTTRWFEIALRVPAGLVDEAAALLDIAGFGGVEVRDHADESDVVVVVECDGDAGGRTAAARDALAALGTGIRAVVTELDPKVWTENWKQHFARRTFAGRIEVRPPWEEANDDPALVQVVINPGMAFGTGLHETTAGCLELLAGRIRGGESVADVGCGSGILAIAAARLGAARVLATDVDPVAVDAARENVTANLADDIVTVELEPGEVGVPEWESDARPGLAAARDVQPATPNGAVTGGFAARRAGAFDLVVANILAETLVEMRDALASAVAPAGALVLSGIEARRLKMVAEAFIGSGWRLVRAVRKGEWVSVELQRLAAGREAEAHLGRARADA